MDTNKMFIDMARQAREFAEMCDRVANESNAVKEDPEAWRERNRQRQAAGVKFEWRNEGIWRRGYKGSIFTFDIGGEEDYREVPQLLPHAAERALWKAQREAGTNEVWQWKYFDGAWIDIDLEPRWTEKEEYRVKPTKLTARICMVGKAYPMSYIGQDWQFTGTREEYHAECEKYGYAVVSEIKEVDKPKTVKRYMAMLKYKTDPPFSCVMDSCHTITLYATRKGYNIIGNIEEREVPIE